MGLADWTDKHPWLGFASVLLAVALLIGAVILAAYPYRQQPRCAVGTPLFKSLGKDAGYRFVGCDVP